MLPGLLRGLIGTFENNSASFGAEHWLVAQVRFNTISIAFFFFFGFLFAAHCVCLCIIFNIFSQNAKKKKKLNYPSPPLTRFLSHPPPRSPFRLSHNLKNSAPLFLQRGSKKLKKKKKPLRASRGAFE